MISNSKYFFSLKDLLRAGSRQVEGECCKYLIIRIKNILNISVVIRKKYLQNLPIYFNIFLFPFLEVLVFTIVVLNINKIILYFSS